MRFFSGDYSGWAKNDVHTRPGTAIGGLLAVACRGGRSEATGLPSGVSRMSLSRMFFTGSGLDWSEGGGRLIWSEKYPNQPPPFGDSGPNQGLEHWSGPTSSADLECRPVSRISLLRVLDFWAICTTK